MLKILFKNQYKKLNHSLFKIFIRNKSLKMKILIISLGIICILALNGERLF